MYNICAYNLFYCAQILFYGEFIVMFNVCFVNFDKKKLLLHELTAHKISFIQQDTLKSNIILDKTLKSPGQDVKRYPNCVRLDNRKVFSCTRS